MRHTCQIAAALLVCATLCSAQEVKDSKTPDTEAPKNLRSGVVTGHVYLDDTKAPARKATVYLAPVAELQSDLQPESRGGSNVGPVSLIVETQFDGRFTFTHVARGSYYVVATCPGYISPLLALSLAKARSKHDRTPLGANQRVAKEKVLQSMPVLDVKSDLPTDADVVLERGGAVSGTVSYDDYGPAAGIRVEVLARMMSDGKETWDPIDSTLNGTSFTLPVTTDDRGKYRISGLPTGEYVVVADAEFSDRKSYISLSGSGTYDSDAHRQSYRFTRAALQ